MELAARIPNRRRRQAIAVSAIAIALLSSVTYWLANSGTTGTSVAPAAGLGDAGTVADVVTMSNSVTSSNGGASLQTGKSIARMKIAKDYTNKINVSIAWTNAVDAASVLLNPNAQISIGLYRPVSTIASDGTCSTAGAVKVQDDGPTYFCTLLNTATGSAAVAASKLFVAQTLLSGYLSPSVDGSTTSSCAADSGAPTAWCQPATSFVTVDQRSLYVVASIMTPGGIPHGQQAQVGNLTFFIDVNRAT